MNRDGWMILVALVLFLGATAPARAADPAEGPQEAEVFGVSTAAPYGGNLLVFQAPSQSAPKLGFVSNGDRVQLVRMEGLFAYITCAKFPQGGYAWGSYIKVKDDGGPAVSTDLPTLDRYLREAEDPALRRDPEKLRPLVPRADPGVVASFVPLIKPSQQP